MSLTLKSKLILAFFLAVFLSIASVSLSMFIGANKHCRTSFEISSAAQLRLIDTYITELVFNGMNNARYLAGLESSRSCAGHLSKFFGPRAITTIDPRVMSPLELELFNLFAIMGKSHSDYEAVLIGSQQGGFMQYPVGSMPKGYDPRKRIWYQEALASSRDVELSSVYMTALGYPATTITALVKDEAGKPVGVVGLDLRLDTLTSLVSGLELGRTGYIMILEKDGTILSDPRHRDLNFHQAQDTNIAALKKLSVESKGTFASSIDGEEKLITVLTSESTGWKLACIKDRAEVFECSRSALTSALFIGCGICALFFIGAWLLTLNLLNPLNLLISSTARIAGGDFKAISRDKRFSGEFFILYSSINKMVEKLVRCIGTAEDKAQNAEEKADQVEKAMRKVEETKNTAELIQQDDMSRVAAAFEKIVIQMKSLTARLSSILPQTTENGGRASKKAGFAQQADQILDGMLDIARNSADQMPADAVASEELSPDTKKVNPIPIETRESAEEVMRDLSELMDDMRKLIARLRQK